MRPRIKTTPKIVASSSNDTTIQSLCSFNRRAHNETPKTTKSYILICFGMKKTITKSEYDNYASLGLTDLIRIEYA